MFKFYFGNKKPTIVQYAVIGVILTAIIGSLSQCTGIHEKNLWDLLDEIQRKHFPQTPINDFILKDPEKLNRRIQRDVDISIDEYWRNSGLKKAEVYKPIYIEKEINNSLCYTKDCQALGGEIRLCGPWVEGCELAKEN